jgi:peptide/nickel transport system permease protein
MKIMKGIFQSASHTDRREEANKYFTASQWQLVRWRFIQHRAAVIGAIILTIMMFTGVFAEFFTPYSPTTRDSSVIGGPPQMIKFWDKNGFSFRPFVSGLTTTRHPETYRSMVKLDANKRIYLRLFVRGEEYKLLGFISWDVHLFGTDQGKIHLFGTDELSRDVFSRCIYASRTSLSIGILGTLTAFFLGLIIGGISGYSSGWVDYVLQRLTEIVRVIPVIPLYMGLAAAFPKTWTNLQVYFAMTMVFGLVRWPTLSRRVRSHLLSQRKEDYVTAARLSGASVSRIISRHLLPSFTSYIIVDLVISFPYVILSETALSFVGFGLRAPSVSWGVLLREAQNVRTIEQAPWLFIPAVFVVVAVLAFTLIGDGLRDAADPYSSSHLRASKPASGSPEHRDALPETQAQIEFLQKESLLSVRNLRISFQADEGVITAVEGVDFQIDQGRTLGIVGESGSGKTVATRAIVKLLPKNAIYGDRSEINFRMSNGNIVDIASLDSNSPELRKIRGGEISMIFQEPMASFSPVYTIGNQMMEAILLHRNIGKPEARECAIEMLDRVGVSNPKLRFDQYSHELSGGMRQRAMIAMALVTHPSLLIADEPTTALDMTIQAQILDLIKKLQQDLGMAVIFITHNMGVIAHMADEIAVMYLGVIVERGPTASVIQHPKHPYTQGLLAALPDIHKKEKRLSSVPGDIPSPLERPSGCPFHTRCPKKMPGTCERTMPPRILFGESQYARCFLYQ